MASIPEEAKQVTFSVIDELTSEIVENVTKRLGNWMALQHFLKSLPDDDRNMKEAHEFLSTVLTAVTCWNPYDLTYETDEDSHSENGSPFDSMPVPPLIHWNENQWDELLALIVKLQGKLGANADRKLELVCKTIRLHATLSPIRLTVETELATKSSGPVVIEKDLVDEYVEAIAKIDNDSNLVQDLNSLLVNAPNRTTRRKQGRTGKVTLKPIQDLKDILQQEHFTFKFLQLKIDNLMHKWAQRHMGSVQGYLEKVEETPLKQTQTPSKRRSLAADHHRGVPEAPGSSKKKLPVSPAEKSDLVQVGGVQILDDDDDEEDGSIEEDHNIVTESGGRKRKRRQLFTNKEKDAIKIGAQKLGIESWRAIGDLYPDLLGHRSSKTIKNCYKTMVKNQEIIEETDDEASESDKTERNSPKKKRMKVKILQSPTKTFVRRKWTEEERGAVRRGVYKYKPGEWAKIKQDPEFSDALQRRTALQLKDCYRVMCKNGSINATAHDRNP